MRPRLHLSPPQGRRDPGVFRGWFARRPRSQLPRFSASGLKARASNLEATVRSPSGDTLRKVAASGFGFRFIPRNASASGAALPVSCRVECRRTSSSVKPIAFECAVIGTFGRRHSTAISADAATSKTNAVNLSQPGLRRTMRRTPDTRHTSRRVTQIHHDRRHGTKRASRLPGFLA